MESREKSVTRKSKGSQSKERKKKLNGMGKVANEPEKGKKKK